MHTSTRDYQDCGDLRGVGTLYTGLGYNIASQLRRVGWAPSPGCHDVPIPSFAILRPGFVHQPRHSKHHLSTLDKEGEGLEVLFLRTSARG